MIQIDRLAVIRSKAAFGPALITAQATKIVHANQNATLWLSKETDATVEGDSPVIENKELYR